MPPFRKTRDTQASRQRKAVKSTFVPIAIGQVLASCEQLTQGDLYRPGSYLQGFSATRQPVGSWRRRICEVLDHRWTPIALAAVNLGSAVALLIGNDRRGLTISSASLIGLCNRLNEIRTPYGRDGADQMVAIVTHYRALTALIPNPVQSDELFLRAVNFQVALSYFVSGISKLLSSSWMMGDAVGKVLQTETYGQSWAARALMRYPRAAAVISVTTPIWEASFPLIYFLNKRKANYLLMVIKAFHLGIAVVMELPRFFWGFAGSHGAVQYVLRDGATRG